MKKFAVLAAAIVVTFAFNTEAYSAKAPDVVERMPGKSMFFCGYCHILTYPKVIKKAHATWKTSKHKKIPCADCHYPPVIGDIGIPEHDSIPSDEEGEARQKTDIEFMKTELEVLSSLVTIMNMDEETVLRRSKVDDRNCTASKCHPKTGKGKRGKYWTKKIKYVEYKRLDKTKGTVLFTHKGHFDEKKWVKGDKMHCTTCHMRQTRKKHFEVSKGTCFLCHFANAEMGAKGRSDCALCHKIPTAPLQKQKKEGEKAKKGEEPITHKKLRKNKVPCMDCHLEVIKGDGKINMEKCLDCHDNEKSIMKDSKKLEVMHSKHVAAQTARCLNCHEPIDHKRAANKAEFLDYSRAMCSKCHPDHHIFQKKLLLGEARGDIPGTPALMSDVRSNCFACHDVKKTKVVRGEKVAHGNAKKCVACHKEKHEEMVKQWKDKIKEEFDATKEIEKEALNAIKAAKGKAPAKKIKAAEAMVKKGRESLQIVEYGGGVHNKKYSIMLLDDAMNNFEDAIDSLGEGEE